MEVHFDISVIEMPFVPFMIKYSNLLQEKLEEMILLKYGRRVGPEYDDEEEEEENVDEEEDEEEIEEPKSDDEVGLLFVKYIVELLYNHCSSICYVQPLF